MELAMLSSFLPLGPDVGLHYLVRVYEGQWRLTKQPAQPLIHSFSAHLVGHDELPRTITQ